MTRAGRFDVFRTLAAALVLCAVAALASACASDGNGSGGGTEVVDRWQQATPPQQPYKTVFVLGVAESDDLRRLFEDEFVRQLQAKGARGLASYGVIPQGEGTRDEGGRAGRARGADGRDVTGRASGREREQRHTASFSPDGHSTHYSNASRSLASPVPPVVTRTEVVTLETRLFDAASERMMWTASTELFDPRKTQSEVARLVRAIVKDLQKGKLI